MHAFKSGVLFVCLFVMRVMRFAAVGRNEACGVSTQSPRWGGVRNTSFVVVRAPGAEIRDFKVFTGPKWPENGENGQIREIPEKSHDSNPAEIMLFGSVNNLLKIKTSAKMHQNYQMVFLNVF